MGVTWMEGPRTNLGALERRQICFPFFNLLSFICLSVIHWYVPPIQQGSRMHKKPEKYDYSLSDNISVFLYSLQN